jgi:osmoprotectant transport system substrate-binding protein
MRIRPVRSRFGARRSAVAAITAVSVLLAGCTPDARDPVTASGGSALEDDAITVGGFNFDESTLLAELYAQALEAEGFTVQRRLDVGPREIVLPALELGMLELVPEYSGAALEYYTDELVTGIGSGETLRRLRAAVEPVGLRTLAAAPAQDRDVLAVTRATAERHDLERVSDLRGLAPRLVFGAPPECPVRPTCLPGLERVYDLRFADFVALDVGGPVTSSALLEGIVDVAQVFTTDADVLLHDFVILIDDRGLQPAQNVVPIVRPEVAQRFGPQVASTVEAVSRRLTTHQVAVMDELIERGRSAESVAADWLARRGLGGA